MKSSRSPFAPDNLVLLISMFRLNLVLTYRIPPEFSDGVHSLSIGTHYVL